VGIKKCKEKAAWKTWHRREDSNILFFKKQVERVWAGLM